VTTRQDTASKVCARVARDGQPLIEVEISGSAIRLTVAGATAELTAAESEAVGYALLLAGIGTFQ
jgi:hypothetical protein